MRRVALALLLHSIVLASCATACACDNDLVALPQIPARDHLPELLNSMQFNGEGVEVGVNMGRLSAMLLSRWRGRRLHCVDLWGEYSGYKSGMNQPSRLSAAFNATMVALSRFPVERYAIHRGTSVSRAADFADGALDFAYIDANHQMEYVAADIAAYYPKVRPCGLMAGDDLFLREPVNGVRQATLDFALNHGLSVFTTPLNHRGSGFCNMHKDEYSPVGSVQCHADWYLQKPAACSEAAPSRDVLVALQESARGPTAGRATLIFDTAAELAAFAERHATTLAKSGAIVHATRPAATEPRDGVGMTWRSLQQTPNNSQAYIHLTRASQQHSTAGREGSGHGLLCTTYPKLAPLGLLIFEGVPLTGKASEALQKAAARAHLTLLFTRPAPCSPRVPCTASFYAFKTGPEPSLEACRHSLYSQSASR